MIPGKSSHDADPMAASHKGLTQIIKQMRGRAGVGGKVGGEEEYMHGWERSVARSQRKGVFLFRGPFHAEPNHLHRQEVGFLINDQIRRRPDLLAREFIFFCLLISDLCPLTASHGHRLTGTQRFHRGERSARCGNVTLEWNREGLTISQS